ncbi:uncharacterized protein LOC119361729 [Triticum dicoccoides]|uniref:uncharacterized protein LOC119361729 n=1 Tax=Triticum dicoccoides TaxID=85692 RepID=UPI000E7A30FF|nr:uncharacterized protein LOC119361729 [Triticum dicoccoides]
MSSLPPVATISCIAIDAREDLRRKEYATAISRMEFLVQPIRRTALMEEVNGNEICSRCTIQLWRQDPKSSPNGHSPQVALTGRFVRRMGQPQSRGMMNLKNLSNL